MYNSRPYTRSHTDGCRPRPKREVAALRVEQLAELGDHPRASHRATEGVRKFADVDGARDIRVPMTEEKRDLVDALASQERSTGNRVPEAIHRWQCSVGNVDRTSELVDLAQDRERRVAPRVGCQLLCVSECSADVPLLQRSTVRVENT
jgi:hypothetical protein